ncbi:hypothetical protein [Salinibacter ruber]|uniref:hypothetical protein n=1 Tax=Salinibacter ruber TaxID=146919 RepID=UPI002169BA23|nr:hypothetical protein [Salinibacter ruber]MCS4149349.1 hypothetical protein [Salinibacter ruber]
MSKSWDRVERLCLKTVSSILNQTSDNYNIVLVCNRPPKLLRRSEKLDIKTGNYTIPRNKSEMMNDKNKKARDGIIKCNKSKGDYVTIMDPDDRIGNFLVEKLLCSSKSDLKVLEKGYVWPYNRKFLFKWNNLNITFHMYRGNNMPTKNNKERDFLIHKNHSKEVEIAKKRGLSIDKMNSRSYCYITDTEDNHSGTSFTSYLHKKRFIKKLLGIRPLTHNLRQKFCID